MFLRQSSKGSNYSILGEMVFTISFPGTEYSYNHVLKELFFNYTSEKKWKIHRKAPESPGISQLSHMQLS